MKKNILLLLAFFAFLLCPMQAFAQEAKEALVIDTVRYEQETQDLTQEYQDTLSTYESKYAQFRLAKAEYEQLQTLTSLEEAVKATREFFVARDEVLLRYTKLLRLQLYQSFGIFFDTKKEKIAVLDELIAQLETHLEVSKNIADKDDVMNRTLEFVPIAQALQTQTESIVPLFSIGKLQSVFDKAMLLTDAIESSFAKQELSAAKQAEKKRALAVIREKEAQLKADLLEVNGPAILDAHGNVVESQIDPNSVYAGISQVLAYLEEILK